MATSGSVNVTATKYDTLRFRWSLSNQSVANNTSSVSWWLELVSGAYGKISSSASKKWSVSVNGTNYSGSNSVSIGNNATKTLASGTTTITHNSDGTKTFSFSFSQEFAITFSGSWVGTKSGSGSGVLTTIPRKSTLTVANGTLGTAQTITISRASSSFTHTLTYKCGSATGTIATKSTATSFTFTPPINLSSQNTAGTSVTITYTLTTYSGSTGLGSNSYSRTCSIPTSVKPSCTVQVLDGTNYQTTYGNLVKGLSTLKIKVTGTTSYSSPIASYSVTADGKKYTSAEFTTPALSAAGTVTVSATVTDKRGRTSSAATTSFSVIDYNPPVITSLTVHRCDAAGVDNDQGEYIKATFSATVTALNNKNSAAYKLRYKKTSVEDFTEVTFSDLTGEYEVTNKSYIFAADSNASYNVEIVATDDIREVKLATSASTAFTLINWKSDGTGFAFGKVAEEANTLQNALVLNQLGNRYTMGSPGVSGSQGYVLMASIKITAANADAPITFTLTRRRAVAPMNVYVLLSNSDMTGSSVSSIKYEGADYDVYLSSLGDMSWGLYVLKNQADDDITVQDWYTSKQMNNRIEVTFPGTLVDTVPTPSYKATPVTFDSMLDFFYPVYTIYKTASSTFNPADSFGGKWEKIGSASGIYEWKRTA